MIETALKLLKKIEENGFEAYIVGGFVRDYLLGLESNDVDICTSATPKDIRDIFQEACLPHEDYGSVTLLMRNVRFEITTFRKEFTYVNNRRPLDITYISDLREDLLRRDFTINTICMNSKKEIIDLFHGQEDLNKKEICTIGDSYEKFSQDSLRILRAVRFATSLNFTLHPVVKEAILTTKHLLKNLSYQRKKEELERIFMSPNVMHGVSLLIELGLDEVLEIPKLKDVPSFDDVMGVWAWLDVMDVYPFSRNEKELITDIQKALSLSNLDPVVLFQYKLYVNSVAGNLKGISKKEITKAYVDLPIHYRKEIEISSDDICQLLKLEPGPFLKNIWIDLETKILNKKLENNFQEIQNYIIETYSKHTFS